MYNIVSEIDMTEESIDPARHDPGLRWHAQVSPKSEHQTEADAKPVFEVEPITSKSL